MFETTVTIWKPLNFRNTIKS